MLIKKKSTKKWHWYLLLIILILSLILKIYSYYWPKAQIFIGNQTLKVLVAKNSQHFYKGLGGKKKLDKYDGMLFIFPDQAQHTMVMRDMKFAIDIVWLNNYRIVDIAPNVQPEPNKIEGQFTPYFGRLSSDMVLELKAGFTQKNKVKIGDIIKIIR